MANENLGQYTNLPSMVATRKNGGESFEKLAWLPKNRSLAALGMTRR
jgi:hypothetical protein